MPKKQISQELWQIQFRKVLKGGEDVVSNPHGGSFKSLSTVDRGRLPPYGSECVCFFF